MELRHIHIFQRELNPNLFRVDLALGKQDNRLHMGRGNSIDVRLPLFVLGNKSTDRSYPGYHQ